MGRRWPLPVVAVAPTRRAGGPYAGAVFLRSPGGSFL
jgi:hypothetical protein